MSLARPFRMLGRMSERMIADVLTQPDAAIELTLRPALFSDFTGQAKVKERLEITVAAAQRRGEMRYQAFLVSVVSTTGAHRNLMV